MLVSAVYLPLLIELGLQPVWTRYWAVNCQLHFSLEGEIKHGSHIGGKSTVLSWVHFYPLPHPTTTTHMCARLHQAGRSQSVQSYWAIGTQKFKKMHISCLLWHFWGRGRTKQASKVCAQGTMPHRNIAQLYMLAGWHSQTAMHSPTDPKCRQDTRWPRP